MASSLTFHTEVQNIIPIEVLEKYRILPITIKEDKLCLIAKRPLSNDALLELKSITGYKDYELQLVGEDVIIAYTKEFKSGADIFSQYGI